MNQAELKDLIRTEPTLRSTFGEISAELERLKSACDTPPSLIRELQAVQTRHDELKAKLDSIEQAKTQLAALAIEEPAPAPPSEETPTEEEPAGDAPADEPKVDEEGEPQ